jgi:hypothetical protein
MHYFKEVGEIKGTKDQLIDGVQNMSHYLDKDSTLVADLSKKYRE